jgi:hypothetical protein
VTPPSLRRRPVSGLIAIAVLGGCAGESPPAITATVRDSAGVTIVTNDGTDRPLAWTVRPVFVLGGEEDGPEAFYRVSAGLVAVDGADNMTVADPHAARIHHFASDGTHRWSAGHRGSGPGEFENPSGVSAAPEGRIAVFDARRRAVVVFDTLGSMVADRRAGAYTQKLALGVSAEIEERWVYGDDGQAVTIRVLGADDTLELVRTRPVPTYHARMEGCGPAPTLVGPIMLSATPAWDARDTLVAVAAGPEYGVDLYTVAGRLWRTVRRALPARASTIADAEHWAEAHPIRFTRGGGQECRIPPAEMVEKMGYADSLPAIAALVLAPDGSMWIRRWTVSEGQGPIDLFDPSGAYVGTLPATFPFPLDVRSDGRLLYAEKDSLDVERLVIAEVVRE